MESVANAGALIEQTKKFWGEYSGEEINDADAQEAINNITEFFRLLDAWDRREPGTTKKC